MMGTLDPQDFFFWTSEGPIIFFYWLQVPNNYITTNGLQYGMSNVQFGGCHFEYRNFNAKLGSKTTMTGKLHFVIKWLPGVSGKKVYPLKSIEFDQESDGNVFRTS